MSNTNYQILSKELARCIDHTLLEAMATKEQIKKLCDEAKSYGFCCVFVNPRWTSLAAEELKGTDIKTGSVFSFPIGADSTETKVAAAKALIATGADEVDMVADLSAIIEGDSRYLSGQLQAVLDVCRAARPAVVLKVIIEAAALNDEQKI